MLYIDLKYSKNMKKTITAMRFKLGQLIEDNEQIHW